jgi:hypothetical protein
MGMVLVACLAARAARVIGGHDDINLERNQFGRKSGEPVELPLGIAEFDHEVAALDVTEVTQSLTEGLARPGTKGQVLPQPAYSSDLGRLLGVRGDRPPDGRAAEEADEHSPSHASPPKLRGCQSIRWRTLALKQLLHRKVPRRARSVADHFSPWALCPLSECFCRGASRRRGKGATFGREQVQQGACDIAEKIEV